MINRGTKAGLLFLFGTVVVIVGFFVFVDFNKPSFTGPTVIWTANNRRSNVEDNPQLVEVLRKRMRALENLELVEKQLSPALRGSYDRVIITDNPVFWKNQEDENILASYSRRTIYIKTDTLINNRWAVAHEAQHAFEDSPAGKHIQRRWQLIPEMGLTSYSKSKLDEDSAEWVTEILKRASEEKSALDNISLSLLRDHHSPYGKNLKLLFDAGAITSEQYLAAQGYI